MSDEQRPAASPETTKCYRKLKLGQTLKVGDAEIAIVDISRTAVRLRFVLPEDVTVTKPQEEAKK
jgi:sRNA-binding carbon storage regulator CsrA